MNPKAAVVLGQILGAHGLQGDVRVRITGDSASNLLEAEFVWLGRTPEDPARRRVSVARCGPGRPGEVRLRFEGIADRDAAEALKGHCVLTEAEQLAPLPEGEYYWHQLIGCRVESESGVAIGRVRELWETGAHDVLVVVDDSGLRRLVPTAAELMRSVDLEAGRIVVVDLPGLLDPV